MLQVKRLLALFALTTAFAGCGEMWGMEEKIEKNEIEKNDEVKNKPVIIFGDCSFSPDRIFVNIKDKKDENGEYQPPFSNEHKIFEKTNREKLEKEIKKEGGNLLEVEGTIYIKRGPTAPPNTTIGEYSPPQNTMLVKKNDLSFNINVIISKVLKNCISNIPKVEKRFFKGKLDNFEEEMKNEKDKLVQLSELIKKLLREDKNFADIKQIDLENERYDENSNENNNIEKNEQSNERYDENSNESNDSERLEEELNIVNPEIKIENDLRIENNLNDKIENDLRIENDLNIENDLRIENDLNDKIEKNEQPKPSDAFILKIGEPDAEDNGIAIYALNVNDDGNLSKNFNVTPTLLERFYLTKPNNKKLEGFVWKQVATVWEMKENEQINSYVIECAQDQTEFNCDNLEIILREHNSMKKEKLENIEENNQPAAAQLNKLKQNLKTYNLAVGKGNWKKSKKKKKKNNKK